MALEAVVFPAQELFRHSMVGGAGPWFYGMAGVLEEEAVMGAGSTDRIGDGSFTSNGDEKSPERGPGELDVLRGSWPGPSCSSLSTRGFEEPRDVDVEYSSNAADDDDGGGFPAAGGAGRRKRQRARRSRNREEAENQRMTHIAVERNRRRQMNDYLAALRLLMPPSYVQRGDQASIVGGAINFVKELEQLLQSLEAQKRTRQLQQQQQPPSGDALPSPFGGFFTFPQYSSSSSSASTTKSGAATTSTSPPPHCHPAIVDGAGPATRDVDASAAADVEVTMVESHASLKVLSRRRPRQLLGMVAGLQGLHLTTLHLNVTTVDDLVLYSFSLKVEDDCQLSSVNEIATAVHQMLDSTSPAAPLQPTQLHPMISSSPPAMATVQRRD